MNCNICRAKVTTLPTFHLSSWCITNQKQHFKNGKEHYFVQVIWITMHMYRNMLFFFFQRSENLKDLRFLTVVLLKIQVFWDVTLCCWVMSYWHFEWAWCLHLSGLSSTRRLLFVWMVKVKATQSFQTHQLPGDTAAHPTRCESSSTLLCKPQNSKTSELLLRTAVLLYANHTVLRTLMHINDQYKFAMMKMQNMHTHTYIYKVVQIWPGLICV